MDETHDRSRLAERADSLAEIGSQIVTRLDALSAARDVALPLGRQIVRLSANAVRCLHRNDGDSAATLLREAQGLLAHVKVVTEHHPGLYWAGYVQDAMKEYAEAAITAAMLQDSPLPVPGALGVEDAPFLSALAEAASELRRDTLDALRADNVDRAAYLLEQMDAVYAVLVTVDFPDAVTGGLRRTTDQLRAVLERTRGDVTIGLRQHRLERALGRMEIALDKRS